LPVSFFPVQIIYRIVSYSENMPGNERCLMAENEDECTET